MTLTGHGFARLKKKFKKWNFNYMLITIEIFKVKLRLT